MSRATLCTLLGELGYEGADALDPDSFEWPFQYDDARPILDWICSSLRPSNVLSLAVLSPYFSFSEALLLGDVLWNPVPSTYGLLFFPMNATLAYNAEALQLQRQLGHLHSQFGRRARVPAISTVNGHLTTIDDSLSMNAVLGRMASTAQELAHYHFWGWYYTLLPFRDGIHLAYSDFHPYLIGDSSCIKELNQWFAKQLDTGPFRLVVEEGKSKCSWVSLEDISNIIVRADLEKSHHQRVPEFVRRPSCWATQKSLNLKQKTLLPSLLSPENNTPAMHKQHSRLADTMNKGFHNLHYINNVDTDILQGDYDLKIMRQEYYINRQKAFINHLVNQLARHQFLKMACQLEKKTCSDHTPCLKLLNQRCMPTYQQQNLSLSLLDDQDHFLHGVNARVGLSTNVSAPGIVQQRSSVNSDLMTLQSDLENSLPDPGIVSAPGIVNGLCTLIQRLQQLLFASSTTAQPILTPRKINAKLSAAVEEVTLEHRKKNEIVKHHAKEIGLQRGVFVEFFCNPDRLRSQVRELTCVSELCRFHIACIFIVPTYLCVVERG
ncbi:HAUS augmin-like complex subunit 3 [Pyrus ussuriensis x Pyrus communis]|uniref:HAUS augmin-like complex subunit 3 n=1 Tax=Pyrus ussuriensis x Pyrus communis TaxID=2448454 RepID=A0A5N5IBM0_9ROSA|nr:HAUS augmin-like complex subunit 3 [Pyrus ussuriensis x Pyrus communis]